MFDQEHLIKVVREQRLLWDKRHKNYRNRLLTKRAWRNVADGLGCSREEAQSKWKNLRDSFSRELKKIPKKRSGIEQEEYTGDWLHFDALQFLKAVIRPRKTTATARSRKSLADETDDVDEESAVSVMSNSSGLSSNTDNQTYLQSELDSFTSIQYGSNENTVPADSLLLSDMLLQNDYPTSDVPAAVEDKNIKHKDYTVMLAHLERQKFDLLKKEIEFQEDEDMNWFKSILPHMRTLSPFNKFLFRTKVQEMLLGELAKLNSSQSESSTYQNLRSTSSANAK